MSLFRGIPSDEGCPRYEEERRREYPREDDRRRPYGGQDERSPPRGGSPDRRSPTPVGTVTLSQRKRKASGWDVHAPGYEQYSAMQAKQTGADRSVWNKMYLSDVANTAT
jgi:splicing factor U2AF subunit